MPGFFDECAELIAVCFLQAKAYSESYGKTLIFIILLRLSALDKQ